MSQDDMEDLLEAAKAVLATDPARALGMLEDGRPPDAPLPYAMALARAALAAGQPGRARECLEDALGRAARPQAGALRLLTDAHLAAGDMAAAAACSRQAVAAGADRAGLPLRHLILLHETAGDEEEARSLDGLFARRAAIDDTQRKIAYVPCPKAACSVLKATVVMNGPHRAAYEGSGQTIHNFCARTWPQGSAILSGPETFRFTVLRDPASRLLSAYLNKFIGGGPQGGRMKADKAATIRGAQRVCGVPDDPARSISFEEFCRYLATVSDAAMNEHWMPQARFAGADLSRYHHVGDFLRLEQSFTLLQDRFDYVPERDSTRHLDGSTRNTTRFDAAEKPDAPARLLPAALRRYRTGGYPPAALFLTDGIREIIARRFAVDTALYAAARR